MTHFSAATVRSVRRAHSVTHKALQRCKLVSSQSVARTFSTGTAAVYTPGDAEEYETKVADSAHLNLEDRSCFQLTKETINENILKAEYAVRGPVLERALEIEGKLKENPDLFPFKKIVKCNIGNPQALAQKPITFTRQVLSLVLNPDLLSNQDILKAFPEDAVARAHAYLADVKSVGAYSESSGMSIVRKEVADFIARRDGVKVQENDVFLTSGASDGVEHIMRMLLRSPSDAILIPIPQYPLYSALTTVYNGHFAPYLMDEQAGWELSMDEIRKSLTTAREQGKDVRAMVVINPGNPTGSVLSESSMQEIVNFCMDEKIVLMADEVYQKNIYGKDKKFTSFRETAKNMGVVSSEGTLLKPLQLASFHSSSKGVVGECGLRSGYLDLMGFSDEVRKEIYKLASIKLCSNVPGQIAMGLMVNPPSEGDESFEGYKAEVDTIFESLKRRSKKLQQCLNSLPGVQCNDIEGAMYAFPKIELPDAFIQKAKELGQNPETMYSIQTLEETGLVIVPGSGFGQAEGSYHFRTTFLPPDDEFDEVLDRFSRFHSSFMKNYS